jgi:acetyl esterase/lipase
VAELDILRDQSHALAEKLRRARQVVELEEVAGVTHGFLSYGRDLPQAGQAIEAACRWVLAGAGSGDA